MSTVYGARPSISSLSIKRQEWDSLMLATSVRVVRGRLSGLGAMWTSSVVTYFRDVETWRPTLSVMSTSQNAFAGQLYDLSTATAVMLGTTAAAPPATASLSKPTTSDTSSISSVQSDMSPITNRVLLIEYETGCKIYIRVPTGPLADLWTSTLNAKSGQKESTSAIGSQCAGVPGKATSTRNSKGASSGNVVSTRSIGASE
ncbi:hypothetical protein BC828DRAFT_386289 [Blastocladiella britannica]|nr:hypothetical protein BC828DRAFT_386289 [Blastocladiella britannica]